MSTPMGPEPQRTVCPTCQKSIETKVEYKASNRTHILAVILCIFGCCPCAACLYCTKCARNVEHYCPDCNTYLGGYER